MKKKLAAAILCISIPLSAGGAAAQENHWTGAALAFDNISTKGNTISETGAVMASPIAYSHGFHAANLLKATRPMVPPPRIWGPPEKFDVHTQPRGIGPASKKSKPGYWRGLLGGLLGLLLAPIAFALEVVQAVALTPVRMARGMAAGEGLSILEPVRTVKNLALDAVATAAGMLSSATAPVWNAVFPDETTDFIYANNRLIFLGGPIAGIAMKRGWSAGFTPTWHTNFITRTALSQPYAKNGDNIYAHEYVHNKQIQKSFLWEKTGENYNGFAGWDDERTYEYLNW